MASSGKIFAGFYPSSNGDRKYSAKDFADIFNNLISDGILPSSGATIDGEELVPFYVKANADNASQVIIHPGSGWFNNTWFRLKTNYYLDMEDVVAYRDANTRASGSMCDPAADRVDAIAIEVNFEDSIRTSRFAILEGVTDTGVYSTYRKVNEDGTVLRDFHVIAVGLRPKNGGRSISGINNLQGHGGWGSAFITSLVGEATDISSLFIHWQSSIDGLITQWNDAISKIASHNFTYVPNSITADMISNALYKYFDRHCTITLNKDNWVEGSTDDGHSYYYQAFSGNNTIVFSSTDQPFFYPVFDDNTGSASAAYTLSLYETDARTKEMYSYISRIDVIPNASDTTSIIVYSEELPEYTYKIGVRVVNSLPPA